jgi:flagellar hook-associated protein 2
MSGISSGIGLISGINTAALIDQLIAIERRPVGHLQTRVDAIDIQRAAFMEISAKLLAVQNAVTNFGRLSFFRRFSSASTNEDVLTAAASADAAPGTHTFRVRSLVANHSLISRGFADADTTPVGVGTLTLESGLARVNRSTELDLLNGGAGVRRGKITIADRSGAATTIDLTTALTVDDVLDAINTNTRINVRAYVTGVSSNGATGDRIVIEDLTVPEEVTGNLTIADTLGGSTASDLGIAADVAAGRVDGRDLVRLSTSTALSLLNDGNGMGRFRTGTDLEFSTALGDFSVSLTSLLVHELDTDLRLLNSGNGVRLGIMRITDRSGQSAEIDLSNARTIRDVLDAINAADTAVSATIIGVNDDSLLVLTDSSHVPEALEETDNAPKLIVEDVTGFTAADLGIAAEVQGDSIKGSSIYRIATIGDVINAINYAPDNNSLVRASISDDGNGITLRALGLDNRLTVTAGVKEDGEVSTAAFDLGLLGADGVATYRSSRLISGLNTVLLQSLNGGRGAGVGDVSFTDRAGRTATIDFSSAQTLQDVIDLINLDESTSLTAAINPAGSGIVLRDGSGGSGPVVVEDMGGTLAVDLGIAGIFTDPSAEGINSGNLQRKYISRQTLLSDLNGGRGVAAGAFIIKDSSGAVYSVDLSETVTTVGGVIDAINRVARGAVEARINDTGDGIAVFDTSGGSGVLTITDQAGGRTAAGLKLAGTARESENFIDGSFEVHVAIDAGDTLTDLARKINEAGLDASASVLNHGGATNPFSLTITSQVSGRRGELLVDGIGINLGLSTLSKPQDAVVLIGGETDSSPRLVTSSTNTLDGVVPGVTLNLLSASDEPVTVSIAQDVDAIVNAVATFVEKYNDVLDTIDRSTSFDSETMERGPLLGDGTLNLVRNRLVRVATRQFEGVDESVSYLFSVGLRFGSGNRLQFDEDRFRDVYEESPELVEELFTHEETGFGAVLHDTLEQFTREFDGVITRKDGLLTEQQELLNKRIDSLNILLEAKRARLEAQFVALESALASLQGQQAALNALVL